jgi:hypothetical protein
MKADGLSLARLDALIAEGRARARIYRGEDGRGESRASRRRVAHKDPPIDTPPYPTPTPPLPPTPFPRESLAAATARFITGAARRARGVDPGDDQPGTPPDPSHGDDGDRDKSPKEPPEPGSLILDAVRRRGK